MKLSEWLEREDVGREEFGKSVGVTGEAVRRYCKGDRIPDRDTMSQIVVRTAGEVTPNDFFDLPTAVAA